MTDVQKQLVNIESELSGCVTKTVMMTPEEFLKHAHGEITKARDEDQEKSRKRLLALQKSVLYSSDIIEDTNADSIKVPVCVIEQTTFGEQENQIMTPAASAGKNPSSGTVFENDVSKKLAEIEGMLKAFGKPPAPPEPPTPPGAKKPGEEDGKGKEKEKAEKVWPDDMNDPKFVEKGDTSGSGEWGDD